MNCLILISFNQYSYHHHLTPLKTEEEGFISSMLFLSINEQSAKSVFRKITKALSSMRPFQALIDLCSSHGIVQQNKQRNNFFFDDSIHSC